MFTVREEQIVNKAMNQFSAPISVTSREDGSNLLLPTDGDKLKTGKVKEKERFVHVTAKAFDTDFENTRSKYLSHLVPWGFSAQDDRVYLYILLMLLSDAQLCTYSW